MKKILCLFLSACFLINFAFPATAVTVSGETSDYSDEQIETFKTEATECGFDKIIDVEQYIDNAGNDGYDELSVVQIGLPQLIYSGSDSVDSNGEILYNYYFSLEVYFYNPLLYQIDCGTQESAHSDSLGAFLEVNDGEKNIYSSLEGNGAIICLDDYFIEDDGTFEYPDINSMFFKGYIQGYLSTSYADAFIAANSLEFNIYSIKYGFSNLYHGHSSGIYDISIDINRRFEFSGLDHKITHTEPAYDLSVLMGVSDEEIEARYPGRSENLSSEKPLELVYLYESGYNSENTDIYLYFHKFTDCTITGSVTVYMSFGTSTYYPISFEICKQTDNLLKLKTTSDFSKESIKNGYVVSGTTSFGFPILSESHVDSEIRDYYTSTLLCSALSFLNMPSGKVLFRYDLTDYDITSHYEYSTSSFNGIGKQTYTYSYHFYETTKNPCSFISLKLSLPEYCNVALTSNLFNVSPSNSSVGTYSLSSKSDIVFEGGYNFDVSITTDRPLFKCSLPYFLVEYSVGFYKPYTKLGVLEKSGFLVNERISTLSEGADAENKLYVRSETNEELAINVDPTFYRIRSSSKGNGYYETLAQVGMSIPLYVLGLDDEDESNDYRISYVDFQYFEYIIPGIVSTFENIDQAYGISYEGDFISALENVVESRSDFVFSVAPDPECLNLNADGYSYNLLIGQAPTECIDHGNGWGDDYINFIGGLFGVSGKVTNSFPKGETEAFYFQRDKKWNLFEYNVSSEELLSAWEKHKDVYIKAAQEECDRLVKLYQAELDEMLAILDDGKISFEESMTYEWSIGQEEELEQEIGILKRKIANLEAGGLIEGHLTFADTFTLEGYEEASFGTVMNDLGFFEAIKHSLLGMEAEFDGWSIRDIPAFVVIKPEEATSIRLMSDTTFSETYLIAECDVDYMREQMLAALDSGNVYMLMRYDTYLYYAEDATIEYRTSENSSIYSSIGDKTYLFETKVYDEFDIVEIGFVNEYSSAVYTVTMEPITIVHDPSSPAPVTPEDIKDFSDVLFDDDKITGFELFLLVASAIVLIVLVLWIISLFTRGRAKVFLSGTEIESNSKKKNKNKNKKD